MSINSSPTEDIEDIGFNASAMLNRTKQKPIRIMRTKKTKKGRTIKYSTIEKIDEDDEKKYRNIVFEMLKELSPNSTEDELKSFTKVMQKKFHISISRPKLLYVYRKMCEENDIKKTFLYQLWQYLVHVLNGGYTSNEDDRLNYNPAYEHLLSIKKVRTESGVQVVATFTPPYWDKNDRDSSDTIGQMIFKVLLLLFQVFMISFGFTDKKEMTQKEISAFSCEFDCWYCPAKPGFPRSYGDDQPGVIRAMKNNFDTVNQLRERVRGYINVGHPGDKLEVLVLGGTFSSYPEEFQFRFIRDQYYAANTVFDEKRWHYSYTTLIVGIVLWYMFHITKMSYYSSLIFIGFLTMTILNAHYGLRAKKSLEEEIKINETADCRIIGLTLETRPDKITPKELIKFRKFGVTRVQMGVQHFDDDVLKRVNRRCNTRHTIRALQLLKDNCFKVDIHLMPDLPQPLKKDVDVHKPQFEKEDIDWSVDMYQRDVAMLERALTDPNVAADQYKIYPCATLDYTRIKDEFERKVYIPYGGNGKVGDRMFELLYQFQLKVHPWIRINRIVRDFSTENILAGNKNASMRSDHQREFKKRGTKCRDIRSRQAKGNTSNQEQAFIRILDYLASEGQEYFIEFTDELDTCFGFTRYRHTDNAGKDQNGNVIFPELVDTGLIRELHVYGNTVRVNESDGSATQHRGFGRHLLEQAENLARQNDHTKVAVIAGVGVREYYRKLGYVDEGYYQVKYL